MYLVKTPWWLRALYPQLVWRKPASGKVLYLSFDDGPHPTATPFVLNTLQQYGAKASFFCIGKNVLLYPDIYARIKSEGHAVGNHTMHHVNGWKTDDALYLNDVRQAAALIPTGLFRPPYGRIRRTQIKELLNYSVLNDHGAPQIIMWDVLSGDFDLKLSPEGCYSNLLRNAESGSIIVFHDSAKAWDRMSYALPKLLAHFSEKGYQFQSL